MQFERKGYRKKLFSCASFFFSTYVTKKAGFDQRTALKKNQLFLRQQN